MLVNALLNYKRTRIKHQTSSKLAGDNPLVKVQQKCVENLFAVPGCIGKHICCSRFLIAHGTRPGGCKAANCNQYFQFQLFYVGNYFETLANLLGVKNLNCSVLCFCKLLQGKEVHVRTLVEPDRTSEVPDPMPEVLRPTLAVPEQVWDGQWQTQAVQGKNVQFLASRAVGHGERLYDLDEYQFFPFQMKRW